MNTKHAVQRIRRILRWSVGWGFFGFDTLNQALYKQVKKKIKEKEESQQSQNNKNKKNKKKNKKNKNKKNKRKQTSRK